ncbi:ATP-binding protein [Paucibacter sp. APW11]|uniref:histidine kinase n=1 Tax=Roseateles aquae TaxID=3077235 RepID=A0ABU3PC82_9BURK|nr:ATP-binding protein [Paucibacter sp. APW11]MDT9000167.1 ATP-binding protein [Paucibacter sp. APW11]
MSSSKAWRWMHWLGGYGAGGGRRLALTRWFAVVGSLAIGLFAIGMSWLMSSFLATRMLTRDAEISRDFVQSIVNIQQVAGFFRAPTVAPEPSVVEFFAHVAAMPDVLRANVYAPSGRVLWSSRSELIGKSFAVNDELDRALKGRVVVNQEDEDDEAPKAEHQGLAKRSIGFVEDYLPVFDDRNHELIGVIELYRQPVALLEAIASGQRLIWWGAALGGLVLLGVLVAFVRRTEGVLQAQQQRLLEAETLAVLGELSGAVAHSIRNPLVSIRTSAELQREIAGDADEVHGEIIRNVDRIEHLVRTMLTYAAEPADHPQQADLAAVLREAAQRFEPELRQQGKRFELQLAANLGQVSADPVVLAQVLNSLLANAAEATGAGDQVSLRAEREGRQARILLSDTGKGLEAAQLQDIFKPFFTTKPRGLGLGLPLARRIVLRLGGEIAISSELGRGTVVTLQLPLAGAAP